MTVNLGGCYCGELRYEVNGSQEAAFQCHCRECQYITGGNENIVVVFAESDFKYTVGFLKNLIYPSYIKSPTYIFSIFKLYKSFFFLI